MAGCVRAGGAAVGLVTAWLGGELVVRLGVGVDPGAHVDAPSSLTEKEVPVSDALRPGPPQYR